MENTSELLFSYGTLQQRSVQKATFQRLLEGEPDSVIGYVNTMCEIKDPSVLATSGKRHHPMAVASGNAQDMIAGTVFQITPAELAAADIYEVSDYKRVEAPLASGKKAWVYVANNLG